MWSCHRSQQSSNTSDSDQQETVISAGEDLKTDYYGTYTGTLPCADCEGMDIEIQLNKDHTFVKKTTYLGKGDRTFEVKGNFSWFGAKNTITLEGITDAPDKYLVSEGMLTQLDMNGNVITGNLSEKYLLKKVL